MFWDKWKEETGDIKAYIADMELTINRLRDDLSQLQKKKELSDDIGARVAELELKMSKLWSMLTEISPTGKERLSKFGRRFGGQSKR